MLVHYGFPLLSFVKNEVPLFFTVLNTDRRVLIFKLFNVMKRL